MKEAAIGTSGNPHVHQSPRIFGMALGASARTCASLSLGACHIPRTEFGKQAIWQAACDQCGKCRKIRRTKSGKQAIWQATCDQCDEIANIPRTIFGKKAKWWVCGRDKRGIRCYCARGIAKMHIMDAPMSKPLPEAIEPGKLIEMALAVVEADRFPYLATIDGDQPRLRPVSPVKQNGQFGLCRAKLFRLVRRARMCYSADSSCSRRIGLRSASTGSAMTRVIAVGAFALLLVVSVFGDTGFGAAQEQTDFTLAPSAQPFGADNRAELLPPEVEQVGTGGNKELPPPRQVDPAALPQEWGALPITLMVALRLTPNTNLDVGLAGQNIALTRAALLRASAWYLPNFNIGGTYAQHEGNIAKTEGNIEKVDKTSLFVGGGPSVNLALIDGIYGPLVAASVRSAAQAGARRVTNDTLQTVANAYFNVLRARRKLARVDEAIDFLASDRPSPARAQSKGLLSVVESFYKAGGQEALKAEVDRVLIDLLRRQEERASAIQDMRVASAELARLIRLDPTVPLWPVEDFRYPMPLPGDEWAERPFQQLLDVAIANRPELAENRALVQAAYNRVQAAKARPFVPNLIANYNWGDFGGSPDINTGTANGKSFTFYGNSGSIRHFGTRDDFDVSLVWRLQNMGVGDYAAFREQVALRRQAEMRQVQIQDRIIAEIVQAHENILGWRERVKISAKSLFDENGRPDGPIFQALRLNFDRIRNVPGTRPLEVLDSVRRLNDLLDIYAQAITEYERARFHLLVTLGVPTQMIFTRAAGTNSKQAPPAATP